MRRFSLALLALAACTEKAIEVELQLPVGEAADIDVSCVNSVHVILHDGNSSFETLPQQCIDVESPTSLEDLQRQIRGKLSLPMPDTLIAIEMRALSTPTPQFCGAGAAILYGGEEYVGQDAMTLRIAGNLDCRALKNEDRTMRVVDFLALVDTPAGAEPVCKAPDGTADVALGTIRPTMLDLPQFPKFLFDVFPSNLVDAMGSTVLPAWTEAMGASCLAVSVFGNGGFPLGASCVYPGAAAVCGGGATEIAVTRYPIESADTELVEEYPIVVVGSVWDTAAAPKAAVQGAVVTIPEDRGKIVYVKRVGANRFEPTGGTSTDASGLFMAYLRYPTIARVTQGGSAKNVLLSGADLLGSAVIVPLR